MERTATKWVQTPITDEFQGAKLGDARRAQRLKVIASKAAAKPDAGFPQMVGNDSELEGLYRFLKNEAVSADAILQPHVDRTMDRAREAGLVLMLHDTTDFAFGGESSREGLGPLNGNQQGFLGHFALAVLPGEERIPLGVAGLLRLAREGKKGTRKKSWYQTSQDPTRESLRWGQLVTEVEERRDGFECIHVMDREGDIYDALAGMVSTKTRFVVRAAQDRALADGAGRLHEVLEELVPLTERTITVSVRPDKHRDTKASRKHPPRAGRSVTVAASGCQVRIRRPRSAHTESQEITVHVVHVWEPAPVQGEPPVSWTLYTTEPIGTAEQLWRVVDYYRSRWLIEELFKAIKTGCAIERRQLETFHSLRNALSIFIPIAYKMLLARAVARSDPHAPAQRILSTLQLLLLANHLKLPDVPATAEQALLAVAKLGGHLRRNGSPGWLTLARGFEALLWMEVGARAAASEKM